MNKRLQKFFFFGLSILIFDLYFQNQFIKIHICMIRNALFKT